MKSKTKRFSTKELVTYRLSNSTKLVYFDTIEEAIEKAFEQKRLHPRSKKITGYIYDNETKVSTQVSF
jgi:hypothetical protein